MTATPRSDSRANRGLVSRSKRAESSKSNEVNPSSLPIRCVLLVKRGRVRTYPARLRKSGIRPEFPHVFVICVHTNRNTARGGQECPPSLSVRVIRLPRVGREGATNERNFTNKTPYSRDPNFTRIFTDALRSPKSTPSPISRPGPPHHSQEIPVEDPAHVRIGIAASF